MFLGSCSNLELGIIIKDAIENLEHRSLNVKRLIYGQMVTSLNMKAFSLTVLKLTADMREQVLDLLDAPTEAFAWPKMINRPQIETNLHLMADPIDSDDDPNNLLDFE